MGIANPVTPETVSIGSLLGPSQAMVEVRAFARRASRVDVPVLILGETGTGKSLLARAIHGSGRRKSGPFLAVNCAGVPDALFESEFFGHHRGAFTGARDSRRGLMEQAQGGSLLLDEVGELSVPQQAKLLTSLEDGEVRPLGGEKAVRVDLRVLAATSRDLGAEMQDGRFRRELFHRLAVLVCRIPPLRERREDIPVLTRRLLHLFELRHGESAPHLRGDGMDYLMSRTWHGNVRELAHMLEAAMILSDGGGLDAAALRLAHRLGEGTPVAPGSPKREEETGEGRRYSFPDGEEEERDMIRSVLRACRGNKSQAARELGMARNTLRKKLRKYGLAER